MWDIQTSIHNPDFLDRATFILKISRHLVLRPTQRNGGDENFSPLIYWILWTSQAELQAEQENKSGHQEADNFFRWIEFQTYLDPLVPHSKLTARLTAKNLSCHLEITNTVLSIFSGLELRKSKALTAAYREENNAVNGHVVLDNSCGWTASCFILLSK